VAEAARSIDLGTRDVTVVASPHGRATGVYAAPAGDLDAFGPRGVTVAAAAVDGTARELAGAWGRPVLPEPADHGIVVPLRLLRLDGPVLAVSFREGVDAGEAAEDAAALAEALRGLDGVAAFVASANLSAGLGERAPLPSLDGAAAADERVLDALRTHPGSLSDALDDLVRAGSCAAAPLAAFASLFPSATCSVLAYGHPFGVGHVVAATR
jgi:hypothetical protein